MKGRTIVLVSAALLVTHAIVRKVRNGPPSIHYVDYIPGNFNGLCLPPFGIFINRKQQGNTELLKHEMVHWKQFQRMGLLPYFYNYAYDYVRVGYDKHPMEHEARANESAYCRENYTQCVREGLALTAYNPTFRKSA